MIDALFVVFHEFDSTMSLPHHQASWLCTSTDLFARFNQK